MRLSTYIPRTTQDPSMLIIPYWTYVIKISTDQGLLVMMPQVWNKLPYQVWTCADKETFKKDLKTYFFDLYLYS